MIIIINIKTFKIFITGSILIVNKQRKCFTDQLKIHLTSFYISKELVSLKISVRFLKIYNIFLRIYLFTPRRVCVCARARGPKYGHLKLNKKSTELRSLLTVL